MALTITHTAAEGTLLDGTTREDAPTIKPVMRMYQWKWSRHLGAWFQQQSRDKPPRRHRIDGTAGKLRELGYAVDVQVDEAHRSMEDRETDRGERMEQYADRLHARAVRHGTEGRARMDQADAFFQSIPLGQPLLVDHYSYKADRNRREKNLAKWHKGYQQLTYAQHVGHRAETASGHMDRRYAPHQVLNRIARLEVEQRRLQRYLEEGRLDWAYTGGAWKQVRVPITEDNYRAALHRQLGDVDEQLWYWREVRTGQLADGTAQPAYGPQDVSVGDQVRVNGSWHEVVRVNPKSVTVNLFRGASAGSWITHRVEYRELRGVRTVESTVD